MYKQLKKTNTSWTKLQGCLHITNVINIPNQRSFIYYRRHTPHNTEIPKSQNNCMCIILRVREQEKKSSRDYQSTINFLKRWIVFRFLNECKNSQEYVTFSNKDGTNGVTVVLVLCCNLLSCRYLLDLFSCLSGPLPIRNVKNIVNLNDCYFVSAIWTVLGSYFSVRPNALDKSAAIWIYTGSPNIFTPVSTTKTFVMHRINGQQQLPYNEIIPNWMWKPNSKLLQLPVEIELSRYRRFFSLSRCFT